MLLKNKNLKMDIGLFTFLSGSGTWPINFPLAITHNHHSWFRNDTGQEIEASSSAGENLCLLYLV